MLEHEADTPPRLLSGWQITGGAEGLRDWLNGMSPFTSKVIEEKFNARNTGGFSYTTASLEPLVCEGVMLSYGLPNEWVQPPQQYIFGGKGKAEKKKRQHRALRDLGFYRTGKDFGTPDADDFRSAMAHALSWLMRSGHEPTYRMISDWNEKNVG